MGRPSDYNDEIADLICTQVAEGKSLFRVCDETEGFPNHATAFRWLNAHPEFRDKYARAKETMLERMADQINEIADDVTEDANSRRVRVDTRKWLLSKLIPKVYGDAMQLKHADHEGNAMHVKVTRVKGRED
jgi:hypothetical protein